MSDDADERVVDKHPMLRERKWVYLGPIMAAPLAHFAVSTFRLAKTRRAKVAIAVGGVLGATSLSVGMRLFFMADASFVGDKTVEDRFVETASIDSNQREEILKPSAWQIFKEAIKGFG